MKVKFEREKETRNTIKYHEVAEQGKPRSSAPFTYSMGGVRSIRAVPK